MEIKYKAMNYLRISSADDRQGESNSIISQRKMIEEFLKNHPEIEVVGEKVDDGFSGLLFDRPAFKEMMEEIEAGNVNCCITKDLSRLGREYIETGRYLRRIFPEFGVRFIAINDNIDTLNDSADDLTVSIRSVMNESHSRDTAKKTRSALKSKRKSGDYVGACPIYGYKKDEANHNLLVVDEYPASIVRDIFNLKIDGNSAARIAEILNERGVLSPMEYKKHHGLPYPKGGYADKEGAKWSATTIFRILNDETYTGTLVQGKTGTPNYKLRELLKKPPSEWYRVENTHEAIIRNFNFDLVQRILRLDTRTSPNKDKVYTFSGILICGCCGNRMTRKTVPNRNKDIVYHYYYCPTGKKNGCDSGVNMKEQDLIDCVLGCVKAHISNIAEVEKFLADMDADSVVKKLAKNLMTQLEENEQKLSKIRGFTTKLYEHMTLGVLSKEEHKSLKVKYAEDSEVLTKANAILKQEIEDTLSCKHERMTWLEHFKSFENVTTLDRKMVCCLIQSIHVLGKNEIEITFYFQEEYKNALELLSSSTLSAKAVLPGEMFRQTALEVV